MIADAEKTAARLRAMAGDLWWCWQPDGPELWRRLDPTLWRATGHNPVAMLARLEADGALADRLAAFDPADPGAALTALAALEAARERYLAEPDTWHALAGRPIRARDGVGLVGYFSAEYGIHESLPNYSGGLGILSGDHVKSASDLGLPFVAVGLLYRNGYVHQQLDAEGAQVAVYETYDFDALACRPVLGPGRRPLRIEVPIAGEAAQVAVWRVRVGRVDLYLLDTDVDDNPPHLREITARLYGGGPETRIRQELVLGVGGLRALRAMGLAPTVFHLNEGHSSFLQLERLREVYAAGGVTGLDDAIGRIRGDSVFTTHTPVEAGHDRFAPELAWSHLRPFADALGLDRDALLALGRWPGERAAQAPFNMTLLALHTCDHLNGVAALHGEVSRQMFGRFWGDIPEGEVPITSVTNGVHAPSWQAPALARLLDAHLPAGWRDRPSTAPSWKQVDAVPDEALWAVHQDHKRALFTLARAREAARRERLGLLPWTDRLDPDALTIGFARRFAPYKRADLLFSDMARLLAILDRAPGPVQVLFAGKAHPADVAGQALVRAVYKATQSDPLAGRVLLIEDYDIELGRALVQGVDVWLNNPRRPKEASGTSGMKVGMNGGLNLSILDGWWPEGYRGDNGWTIGDTRGYPSAEAQDAADADSLYCRLERDVIPLYYERDAAGLPRRWLHMMKAAIRTVTPQFHSDRQVQDYVNHLYAPG
ncbi:MAG: alpha-glucan family phosphorylase [bacterium]|nr:alpha-glucan family phosphorylase [Myxococcales bacterium]